MKWRPRHAALAVVILVAGSYFCWVFVHVYDRALREKREHDATQRLRDIRSAETIYQGRHGRFGTTSELVADGLLTDGSAESRFRVELVPNANGFEASSIPAERDDRLAFVGWSFFVDESGIIRGDVCGRDNGYRAAERTDAPIRYQ